MDEGKEEAHDIMTWFRRSTQQPSDWHRPYQQGSGRHLFSAAQTHNSEVQALRGLVN